MVIKEDGYNVPGQMLVNLTNKKGGEISFGGTNKGRYFNLPNSWLADVTGNAFRIEFSIYIGQHSGGEYIIMSMGRGGTGELPKDYGFQLTMQNNSRVLNVYSKTPTKGWLSSSNVNLIYFDLTWNDCVLERMVGNFFFTINGRTVQLTNSEGLVDFFDNNKNVHEEWTFGRRNFWDDSQLSESYFYYLRTYVMLNGKWVLTHSHEMDHNTDSIYNRTIYDRVGFTNGVLNNVDVVKESAYDRSIKTHEQLLINKIAEPIQIFSHMRGYRQYAYYTENWYLVADATKEDWKSFGCSKEPMTSGKVTWELGDFTTTKYHQSMLGLSPRNVADKPSGEDCYQMLNDCNFQIYNVDKYLYQVFGQQFYGDSLKPNDKITIEFCMNQPMKFYVNGVLKHTSTNRMSKVYHIGLCSAAAQSSTLPISLKIENKSLVISGYRPSKSADQRLLEFNQCYNTGADKYHQVRNMSGDSTADLELNNVNINNDWLEFWQNTNNSYAKIPDKHNFFDHIRANKSFFIRFKFMPKGDTATPLQYIWAAGTAGFRPGTTTPDPRIAFTIDTSTGIMTLTTWNATYMRTIYTIGNNIKGYNGYTFYCVVAVAGQYLQLSIYDKVMNRYYHLNKIMMDPGVSELYSWHFGTVHGGGNWYKGWISNILLGNYAISDSEVTALLNDGQF